MIVGLDLDGVIIDHHENKIALARELGYQLERWQTNTNVMRQFLPPDKAKELAKNLYTVSTPRAAPVLGALEAIAKLPKETYIISARDANSIPFAEEWLMKNGVYDIISKERIIFCSNGSEKSPLCEKLEISTFLDDKVSFLNFLPDKTKKILFDEDGVVRELNISPEIQVAGSWSEFLSLLNIS